jgi:hypothetical protein
MTRNWWLCGLVIAGLAAFTACEPATDDGAAEGRAEEPVDERAEVGVSGLRSAPAALAPIDHSGVTGTVVADVGDDEITVTLSLEGLQPGATYLAHVHEDRCAVDGPARVPLGRIAASDEGTAEVELRAELAEMPSREEWSVQVQAVTGEAVACANVSPE